MPAKSSDSGPDTPLILACDTTQGACSVALYRDGIVAHALVPMRTGHAEALMPMIERVLAKANLGLRDIDRLAVTNGPGTFTGVRVGLAAMRGLALALKLPLQAYGTLHVMAHGVHGAHGAHGCALDKPVLVGVDARRETFYAQAFDAACRPLGAAQALNGAAALALHPRGDVALIGSGAQQLASIAPGRFAVENAPDWPDAAVLGAMAAHAAPDDGRHQPALPEPVYLRPPDATMPNRDKFPARRQADT